METPTVSGVVVGDAQPVAAAPAAAPATPFGVTYVTDSKGRQIGLKKPTPGDRFELDDAVATKTQAAAMQVSVVGCVISIDQDGLPPLWTFQDARGEFKKRLNLLGDEGLMAITPAALKLFGIDLDEKALQTAKN